MHLLYNKNIVREKRSSEFTHHTKGYSFSALYVVLQLSYSSTLDYVGLTEERLNRQDSILIFEVVDAAERAV